MATLQFSVVTQYGLTLESVKHANQNTAAFAYMIDHVQSTVANCFTFHGNGKLEYFWIKHGNQQGNIYGFLNSRAILIHTTKLYTCTVIKLLILHVFETKKCDAIWCNVLKKLHTSRKNTHVYQNVR
jgi:hypothetical protein